MEETQADEARVAGSVVHAGSEAEVEVPQSRSNRVITAFLGH